MVIINIDVQRLIADFYLTPEDVQDVMDFTVKEITARFAQEWEKEANTVLKSSRQEYISHLTVVDEGFAKGAVVLTGWLPNAIESGLDAFDMKEGFLNGPNAKTSVSGDRYNTIPFSFGTPGALEENFNGGILPQEVYDVLKAKKIDTTTNKSLPLVKDQIPKPFSEPQVKQIKLPGAKDFQEYQHKNSIYEGISKVKDKVTGQNRYESFRRVSDNSSDLAWIHPGIEAQNLAEKVLAKFDIPEEVGKIMDKIL